MNEASLDGTVLGVGADVGPVERAVVVVVGDAVVAAADVVVAAAAAAAVGVAGVVVVAVIAVVAEGKNPPKVLITWSVVPVACCCSQSWNYLVTHRQYCCLHSHEDSSCPDPASLPTLGYEVPCPIPQPPVSD